MRGNRLSERIIVMLFVRNTIGEYERLSMDQQDSKNMASESHEFASIAPGVTFAMGTDDQYNRTVDA
jgi:hypothetical protein